MHSYFVGWYFTGKPRSCLEWSTPMGYFYNWAVCGRSGFRVEKLPLPDWEQQYVRVISGATVLLSFSFLDSPYRQTT